MRPPQLVLNICNSLAHQFSRKGKAAQLETDAAPAEAAAAAEAVAAAAAEEEELPSLEEKVMKHNSLKRPGSPSKVDSAVDLHQTGLRCLAVSALVEIPCTTCLYELSNRAYSTLLGDNPAVVVAWSSAAGKLQRPYMRVKVVMNGGASAAHD